MPLSKPPSLSKPLNENVDDKLDRLLVSFRRQCVDNHLNETLRNSMIFEEFEESYPKTKPQISGNRSSIYQLYSTIPILFHESNSFVSNDEVITIN